MCIACFLVALGAGLSVLPNAGDFQSRQLADFAQLIAPFVPPGRDGAARLAERLIIKAREVACEPRPKTWRHRLPFLRANELELRRRAREAARRTHRLARSAYLAPADHVEARARAGERLLNELAEFYAALGAYDGDPPNRILLRSFAAAGLPFLGASSFALGAVFANDPELCGSAPTIIGQHLHHALYGLGSTAFAGWAWSLATTRGFLWLNALGTAAADRSAGAARAEAVFWKSLARHWANDPDLPKFPTATPTAALELLAAPLAAGCAQWLAPEAS